MTRVVSRETAVGAGAAALAVAAMAVDHLIPNDAPAFLISSALSLALAALLFGWIIPRTKVHQAGAERAANAGLLCSLLAVIPGIALIWLGVPFVLAGGGIALGLLGREGQRRSRATAAVVIGVLVLMLGASAYAVGGSDVTG